MNQSLNASIEVVIYAIGSCPVELKGGLGKHGRPSGRVRGLQRGGKMKIALAADHAGFALKEKIREYLKSKGLEVEDHGPSTTERVDYPDFAEKVAGEVAATQADYGVLVCGTGIGMMLAANKVPGIRAVAANDTISARMAREHNNANVLTLGGRMIDEASMHQIVDTWLSTPFAGGRHELRVEKIDAIDQRYHTEKRA
jgi:ribose 5-phosphate isomerase B